MASQAENSHMEYILANPGLRLIADTIISYLDLPDLKRCQQVSQDFKYIITERFVKKIRMFRKNLSSILPKNKRNNISTWYQFLETFDEVSTIEELKVVADFLELYSKKKNQGKSPFLVAILQENTEFINLIMESQIDVSPIVRKVPQGLKYGKPALCFNITDKAHPITLPEWCVIELGGPAPERAIRKRKTVRISGIDGGDIYAIPGFRNQVFIGPFNRANKMVDFEDFD